MLKVLLVDDEPIIAQGISVLIDWEKYGYEIVDTANNGLEALEFLKHNSVDLILADVKMPVMDGIKLLKTIREEKLSDAFFVIVSGYGDFTYAQQAIKYKCTDYILKPVQKQQLLDLAVQVKNLYSTREEQKTEKEEMSRAYFVRYIQALLLGRPDKEALEYVSGKMKFSQNIKYIHMEMEAEEGSLLPQEMRSWQKAVYARCRQYLGSQNEDLVFMDIAGREEWYDIGFIYDNRLAQEKGLEEEAYIQGFLENISDRAEVRVMAYAGETVDSIEKISHSFQTALMAKGFQKFDVEESILYYSQRKEETERGVISAENMELLLKAVEENNRQEISKMVEQVYQEMNSENMEPEMIQVNMNYLLVKLTHLGMAQDDSLNQNEIIQYIRENSFDTHMIRGNRENFQNFMEEYAEYLSELRRNVSNGVLGKVEKEIKEHYQENITLKELSKKYFVNSAYLGQMFRKKYGISFKEYLNHYRIEKAAEYLLRTDEKIYFIGEKVGYKDLDYFINKFIAIKGCTPTNYRKKSKGCVE